jgi:hypothetical protein
MQFVFLRRAIQLLVSTNVVPSSLILSTLMMEAISSSETFVLTKVARHHTPENGIFLVTDVFLFLWQLSCVDFVVTNIMIIVTDKCGYS